jgi:hypothetical protein
MFKRAFLTSGACIIALLSLGCEGRYPTKDTPENAVKAAMAAAARGDFSSFQLALRNAGLARGRFTSAEAMNVLVNQVKTKLSHQDQKKFEQDKDVNIHIEDRGLIEVAKQETAQNEFLLASHRFDVVADDAKVALFGVTVTCTSDAAHETNCGIDDITLDDNSGLDVAQRAKAIED